MNVHIRCKTNVAPSCGVNSVELANKLAEMGLQAEGISKRNSLVRRLPSFKPMSFHQATLLNNVHVFVYVCAASIE